MSTVTKIHTTTKIAAGLLATSVALAAYTVTTTYTKQDVTAQPDACTEVAAWGPMVRTHGVEQATELWDALVWEGWTNPANGDVQYLVPAGCAQP